MSSDAKSDIAIVGAGPIGSYAAARLSRSGYSVSLFEDHTEVGRPEQCAGLVNRGMFELPLLDQVLDEVKLHEITGADIYSPAGRRLELRAGRVKAISIDRARFDKVLFRMAVYSGATPVISAKVERIEQNGDPGFLVHHRGVNGKGVLKARMVLGCDGTSSVVRRDLKLDRPLDVIPGVSMQMEIIRGEVPDDIVGVFTGKDTAKGFFAWAVPAGSSSSLRIGLASETGETLRKGYTALQKDPRLAEWLGTDVNGLDLGSRLSFNIGPVPMGSPRTLISGNAVILGDSAGMAKPTSGGGIYPGLMAGDELAMSVETTGDISPDALEGFRSSWQAGYGKELSRSRFFRKIIREVEDAEIEDVIERFSDPDLLEIINKEGDIDHPLRLALLLIRKDTSLLKMIPRFLPHMRHLM